MKFLIILSFIIKILNEATKSLDFAFYSRFKESEITPDNLMSSLINNDIYTNFLIGDKRQLIEMNIKTQQASTYIISESCTQHDKAKKFNEKISSTYSNITKEDKYYMYEFNKATYSKDNFIFIQKDNTQIEAKEFKFMLVNEFWDDYQKNVGGMFGLILQLKDEQNKKEPDFTELIDQLKEKNIINSFVFALEYTDDYNGILHLGSYFHEYNKSYSEEDFIHTQAGNEHFRIKDWDLNVEKIVSGNNIVQNNTFLKIYYEYGIIAAPTGYHEYIKSTFFKKYLDDKICQEKLNFETIASFKKYYYIECDKNNFNKESFPNLNFYNRDMNLNFSINYKDAFYEYNNKVYFLIVFPIYPITVEYWLVGKPLLKKYLLFLDKDKKTIGLYLNYIPTQENGPIIISPDYSNYITLTIVLSVIVVALIIILVYYFLVIKKPRRVRANELDEKIDYEPYEDKNIIN